MTASGARALLPGTKATALHQSMEPVLVIACAALGRELHAIRRAGGWDHIRIRCLDAALHLRPTEIAPLLRAELERTSGQYRRVFVAYADCGTYGGIDRVLADHPGVERLPGLTCYEVFAGTGRMERLAKDEPGTFYLTDFLVRFFDRLVIDALGLGRHPELVDAYFGNYRRMTYLSQTQDPSLLADAQAAAVRLGLEFRHIHTGYGALNAGIARIAAG